MELTPGTIRSLLEELADWFAFEGCEPVEWVVCGGAAMGLQGLRSRTTRDVDVLGEWDGTVLELVEDFPPVVTKCIEKVTEKHSELRGLGANWINLGPRRLVAYGLPSGFEQRMTSLRFGQHLTLHLLGRSDLLALKLYAAADERGPRQEIHVQDIEALRPTFRELDTAVDWIRGLPDFEEKRLALKEVARELGHDDLAYYI